MDYEKAVTEYLGLRTKVEAINNKAKADAAGLKKQMVMLENWLTLKADKEGLKNITTPAGTAYWSTTHRCSVAAPEEFLSYVIATQRWDLMEKRASKVAVGLEVDENGSPPPGVNYSTVRSFNVRKDHNGDTA